MNKITTTLVLLSVIFTGTTAFSYPESINHQYDIIRETINDGSVKNVINQELGNGSVITSIAPLSGDALMIILSNGVSVHVTRTKHGVAIKRTAPPKSTIL